MNDYAVWLATMWAYSCLTSTYLLRFIPKPGINPGDVKSRWYLIVYNVIRGIAGNNSWTWQVREKAVDAVKEVRGK